MATSITFLLIGLAIGVLVGYLVSRVLTRSSSGGMGGDTGQFEQKIKTLEQEKNTLLGDKMKLEGRVEKSVEQFTDQKIRIEKAENENKELTSKLASAETQVTQMNLRLKETKTEVEELQQRFAKEFENIANRILDEKSKKFTEQNKTNMDVILNPLKDNIKRFEEQVQKSYKTESDERITLKTEIKNLIDLNKQISEEANNLTKALKGENKTQGNWGELILEKVLERSGLVKDQEYKLQYSTSNEDGKRIQPDAVIMLPDNKHIIVDAKVSLLAYEALVSSNSDEETDLLVKEHLLSVRTHIKTLSEKNYPTSADFNTPDFVLLFIPIESSFSIAVQADQELFNFAWDKKIVIVSPSTLLATLRTIASVWKQERQTKYAIEIAKQSGALYDKFVGFLEDMEKVGKNLDASRNVYEAAMNKLSKGTGNLVKRAQEIQKLGAKNTKDIPDNFLNEE
ncbi:MAG: DNA recombination protein RmuC [Flavobacteriales bacterium]